MAGASVNKAELMVTTETWYRGIDESSVDSGTDEIAEYDSTGALAMRYVPGPAIDEPVVQVSASGGREFLQAGRKGSIVATTSGAGAVTQGPYTYDPYGGCFISTGGICNANGPAYRYAGMRYDSETHLYYDRARIYSPTLGRFLQTDPVGYSADLNLYTYVGNDPTNKTDPTGMYDCNGNTSDCATINKFVAAVDKAASHLNPNSDAGKKVNAVVKYLGKAGDKNGVTIAATQIQGKAVALAGANNTINIDVAKASDITSNGFARANPSMSASDLRHAQGAGAIAHESRHEIDASRVGSPATKADEFRTELNAYTTQAGVYQGLGATSGLSVPGAISSYAGQSANLWCTTAAQQGLAPGGC